MAKHLKHKIIQRFTTINKNHNGLPTRDTRLTFRRAQYCSVRVSAAAIPGPQCWARTRCQQASSPRNSPMREIWWMLKGADCFPQPGSTGIITCRKQETTILNPIPTFLPLTSFQQKIIFSPLETKPLFPF